MTLDTINWFPMALGGACAVIAGATACESLLLFFRGKLRFGTVVGHKKEEGFFFPIVEFITRDGQRRQFAAAFGKEVRRYEKGARVAVVHDSIRRLRPQIRTFWSMGFFPILFSLFASLFFAAACGVFESSPKKNDDAEHIRQLIEVEKKISVTGPQTSLGEISSPEIGNPILPNLVGADSNSKSNGNPAAANP